MTTSGNFAERLENILNKFDEDLKVAKKRKDEAISRLTKDLLTIVGLPGAKKIGG